MLLFISLAHQLFYFLADGGMRDIIAVIQILGDVWRDGWMGGWDIVLYSMYLTFTFDFFQLAAWE